MPRPSASTSSVERPRWTKTLSMITWKNSGVSRPKTCRKNEPIRTSVSGCAVLLHRVDEPGHAEAAVGIGKGRAPAHQDQAADPALREGLAGQQFRRRRRAGAGPAPCPRRPCRSPASRRPGGRPARAGACPPAAPRVEVIARALTGKRLASRRSSGLVQRGAAAVVQDLGRVGRHAQQLQQKRERRRPGVDHPCRGVQCPATVIHKANPRSVASLAVKGNPAKGRIRVVRCRA